MRQLRNQRWSNGLLKLLSRRDDDTNAHDVQEKPDDAHEEHQYFTFSKTGELIDVDDDVVEEIQEQVTRDWRAEYLSRVQDKESDSGQ